MSENFEQLIEGAFVQKPVYPGAVVKAKVLEIDKKDVMVDAGLKSESWIPTQQFLENGELEIEVGSEVDVAIEALEDGFGQTILSREKAKRAAAWAELQTAYDNGETVKGLVTGRVKGGFTVDMGILQGFLPGSQVDIQPVDTSLIEGQELEFKIIKLDFRRNNIVLSRRSALEFAGKAAREKRLNELYVGQVLQASVKNLTDYGAFMHLGDGIDALLHNVDIAWEKIKHPSQVLKPVEGQEDKPITLDVMILKIDREGERPRISVGRKQLLKDPWINLLDNYAVGMRLEKRKVTHIKDYGCFVEIEPGVEGLVHISEMDWTNRNPNPHTLIQREQDEEGRVDVVILDIDVDLERNRRRISLGMKQCKENPWEIFAKKHHKGEYIKGKIRSITDLGLFISLEGNIDGLVHHSEISENLSGEAAVRQFKKGQEVEVSILSIDPTRERVALSMRRSVSDTDTDSDTNTQDNNEITTLSDITPFSKEKPSSKQSGNASREADDIPSEQTHTEEDLNASSEEMITNEEEEIESADTDDVVDVAQTVDLEDLEDGEIEHPSDTDEEDADELANIEYADLPDQLTPTEPVTDLEPTVGSTFEDNQEASIAEQEQVEIAATLNEDGTQDTIEDSVEAITAPESEEDNVDSLEVSPEEESAEEAQDTTADPDSSTEDEEA
jgi:small subunit ribosomal protein S1